MEYSGQYLTFNEYKAMGGTLDQTPFNILELKARQEINKRTQNRLADLESQIPEVKQCVFELIALDNSINNGVETSGNVINYPNEQIVATKREIVRNNLLSCELDDGTPYLYRGV